MKMEAGSLEDTKFVQHVGNFFSWKIGKLYGSSIHCCLPQVVQNSLLSWMLWEWTCSQVNNTNLYVYTISYILMYTQLYVCLHTPVRCYWLDRGLRWSWRYVPELCLSGPIKWVMNCLA